MPRIHIDRRLVIFDFDGLVYDLPGGGLRLLTKADGIEAVVVNGAVTVERGEWTGARAGRVLRG